MIRIQGARLIIATVTALVLIGIGTAYFHWYWPSYQGQLARKNAKQSAITALLIPDVPDLPHLERLRALYPGSITYLLHSPGLTLNGGEANYYSSIDTASNTIQFAGRRDWESATGEIIDSLPIRNDLQSHALAAKPKTAGRHLRSRIIAPYSNSVAIFSADGRLHPPVRGLLFGGRNAYADGQRYVEVQSLDGSSIITPPIAIPSPCSDEPRIWWTADERFVVCRYTCYSDPRTPDSIVFVPTGLEKLSILKSGEQARESGYAVFQTDAWWEEWWGALEFQIRLEHADSPVLLFNMPVLRLNQPDGLLVYKYDPVERTLTLVDSRVWLSATGAIFKESDLRPLDERDPRFEAARQKLNSERTPEDREILRNEAQRQKNADDRRSALLMKAPPKGTNVRGPYFSPDGTRYAIRSFEKDSKMFYHEVFETDSGERTSDELELPDSLGQGPLWTPDGRYLLYHNHWSRILAIVDTKGHKVTSNRIQAVRE